MLFGVVAFPGTNCESEAVRSLKKAGFNAKVILWNEPESTFLACDGLLLAGGFSYEDRGRSGIVAANDVALDAIRKVAQAGKPVIGICNGAQILVESGLITDSKTPSIALTINKRLRDGVVQGVGFYHDWCHLKNVAKIGRSPFNNFLDLIRMPLAHGEGRFVITKSVMEEMKKNDQIVFLYTDEHGQVDPQYPVNPNGSVENIAGICNKAGNVLAMMPHPERSGDEAAALFRGLAEWMKTGVRSQESGVRNEEKAIGSLSAGQKSVYDLELFVETIITDNSCETIRLALEGKIGQSFPLKRMRFFGLNLTGDMLKQAKMIVESDEIANINKEKVFAKVGEDFFVYVKGSGFEEISKESVLPEALSAVLYAFENEDIHAQAKLPKIQHAGIAIKELHSAICWAFPSQVESAIVATGMLANPVSMQLCV